MAFEITRFSEDGLDLLSQISSSKALKIKNIYCDTAYHNDEDIDQDAFWWSSQTTTTMAKVDAVLSALSPVEGQARVIIDLALKAGQTSDVTIRTVIITACAVESGVEGEEVVFVGTTDADGVEVIYRSNVKISTAITLYFKFNNSGNIEIDTGLVPNYVIHSELERFLSCHSADSSVLGEAQTVLGEKTFTEDTTFVKSIDLSSEYDDDCGSLSSYYIEDDDQYQGLLLRSKSVSTGVMTVFSDYDVENELETVAVSITKEKAGYNLNVNGGVIGESFISEYTQGNTEYTCSQMGDKIRLSIDDGVYKSFDLGITSDNNFGVIYNNTPVLEVSTDSVIISGKAEVGGGIELPLDVSGSNVPGTIKMLHSQNTGTMMTFGVGDSLDAPNRGISLSIYEDSIHAHQTLIAESGLQVTGWIQADGFYGDLIGCIPSPFNEYNVPKGSLCILKVGRTNGLLRGAEIVKTAGPNVWSTVGASESFQITLASLENDVAGVAPNLAIGDKFIILSSCGLNGLALAMRSE